MNSIMIAGEEATLTEFIENYNSDTITIDKCFLQEVIQTEKNKMLINGDSILDMYKDAINKTKRKVKLTNEEYIKYRYNPKLLSYDLYGTTEAWFLILQANELHSASEFNLKSPYLYEGAITNYIDKAIDLEKQRIDDNTDYIDKLIER